MIESTIAKRYAQALFALAQERQEIKKVEGELLDIKNTLQTNSQLNALLYHQLVPAAEKKNLVKELFADLSLTSLHFLYLLFDRRRDKFLETIIDEYHEMCLEMEKVITVDIKTAFPLTEDNRKALVARFSALTGKTVEITEEVDEKLIGGVVAKIGDKILDGSVVSRLNLLRSALNKIQL